MPETNTNCRARDKARASGERVYRALTACSQGHLYRYTSTGNCRDCQKGHAKAVSDATPRTGNGYQRNQLSKVDHFLKWLKTDPFAQVSPKGEPKLKTRDAATIRQWNAEGRELWFERGRLVAWRRVQAYRKATAGRWVTARFERVFGLFGLTPKASRPEIAAAYVGLVAKANLDRAKLAEIEQAYKLLRAHSASEIYQQLNKYAREWHPWESRFNVEPDRFEFQGAPVGTFSDEEGPISRVRWEKAGGSSSPGHPNDDPQHDLIYEKLIREVVAAVERIELQAEEEAAALEASRRRMKEWNARAIDAELELMKLEADELARASNKPLLGHNLGPSLEEAGQ